MGGLVPGAGSVGPGREAVGLLASLGSHNVVDASSGCSQALCFL